jgi:transcription elongation GreA/GreB family factor
LVRIDKHGAHALCIVDELQCMTEHRRRHVREHGDARADALNEEQSGGAAYCDQQRQAEERENQFRAHLETAAKPEVEAGHGSSAPAPRSR